jgi:hypothetical protein
MQMEPKQRKFNDRGKGLTKSFGDAMRRLGLPVGEYTSKFNRAYETIVLVGFDGIGRTAAWARAAWWIAQYKVDTRNKQRPKAIALEKRRYKQGDRKCPARPPRR